MTKVDIVSEMDARSCPFCDSDDVSLAQDDYCAFMQCGECYAYGPRSFHARTAVRLWNNHGLRHLDSVEAA